MIENVFIADELTKILVLGLLGCLVGLILTPVYTFFAYRYNFWKKKRTTDTSGNKLEVIARLSTRKHRVPTGAGLIMVLAVTIITVLFNLDRGQTWLPLAALLGAGLVGLIDDYINVRGDGRGVAGIRAPIKFAMITLVAAAAAWFFYYKLGYSSVHVPWLGDFTVGWALIPLFVLAVVSTGNAVNISDGRDGLAGGLLLAAYTAFGVISALQGLYIMAGFCFTVAGTLLTYVWFNIPPARFFMGDVGSFSLGTALGVVAMLTDTLVLLPIIGFVFVMEGGSSLLQILSKKILHRRIFIAAPIHYHFEAKGWDKPKVTMRFWVLGVACAMLGIIIAAAGSI